MDTTNTAAGAANLSHTAKPGGDGMNAGVGAASTASSFHGMAHGAGGGYGSAGAMAVMSDGDNSVGASSNVAS